MKRKFILKASEWVSKLSWIPVSFSAILGISGFSFQIVAWIMIPYIIVGGCFVLYMRSIKCHECGCRPYVEASNFEFSMPVSGKGHDTILKNCPRCGAELQ